MQERVDTLYIATQDAALDTRERPSPLLYQFRYKHKKNKKVVAALLAFPFPFGIVGLHRIYLGCSPYVPVAYIASLGGVFGILPFIDFCVLLLDKDIDRYMNNKKIFMWVN
jgi:TM2 domain-containing membrane protein YozV